MKTVEGFIDEAYLLYQRSPGWCLFLLDEARRMKPTPAEEAQIELLYAQVSWDIGEEKLAISLWEKIEKDPRLYPATSVASLNLSVHRDNDEEHGWTGFEEFLDPRNAPD